MGISENATALVVRTWLIALATTAFASAADAQTQTCLEGRISVETQTATTAVTICKVATQVVPLFQQCGLTQSAPIRVQVGETEHDWMGSYDTNTGTIGIAPPATLRSLLPQASMWQHLASDRHFESVLVHELAHALLHQKTGRVARSVANQEYVAYAMQLSWLTSTERQALFSSVGTEPDNPRAYLNDFIALSAPETFAQAVWSHFRQPWNGCTFVGQLIEGTDTLFIASD